MPELKVKATELVGTKVDFIALVKRGANRIPFRIVKQEDEPMLDLNKIGLALFQKQEKAPEIVAAIVPAETDVVAMADVFQNAGLDPQTFVKTVGDGVVTLAKADAPEAKDTVIIKTGDKIGLVVSGMKKAFDSYAPSSDFGDAIKTQGFFPSFYTAREVMGDCVHMALQKSNSPSEAMERISKTVDDFKAYVGSLAASLPASAFYVDRYYSDMVKTSDDAAAKAILEKAAADKAAEEMKAKDKASDDDEKEKVAKEAADAASAAVAKSEENKTGASEASPELSTIQKQLADFSNLVNALQKSVEDGFKAVRTDVKKDVEQLTNRVEKVSAQAKKAEEAVNGSVFAEADGDKAPVKKSEARVDNLPPLLDTAYNRIDAA